MFSTHRPVSRVHAAPARSADRSPVNRADNSNVPREIRRRIPLTRRKRRAYYRFAERAMNGPAALASLWPCGPRLVCRFQFRVRLSSDAPRSPACFYAWPGRSSGGLPAARRPVSLAFFAAIALSPEPAIVSFSAMLRWLILAPTTIRFVSQPVRHLSQSTFARSLESALGIAVVVIAPFAISPSSPNRRTRAPRRSRRSRRDGSQIA